MAISLGIYPTFSDKPMQYNYIKGWLHLVFVSFPPSCGSTLKIKKNQHLMKRPILMVLFSDETIRLVCWSRGITSCKKWKLRFQKGFFWTGLNQHRYMTTPWFPRKLFINGGLTIYINFVYSISYSSIYSKTSTHSPPFVSTSFTYAFLINITLSHSWWMLFYSQKNMSLICFCFWPTSIKKRP